MLLVSCVIICLCAIMSDNLSLVAKIKFSEKLEFCDQSPNLSRSFKEHDKILFSINVSSVFMSEL